MTPLERITAAAVQARIISREAKNPAVVLPLKKLADELSSIAGTMRVAGSSRPPIGKDRNAV